MCIFLIFSINQILYFIIFNSLKIFSWLIAVVRKAILDNPKYDASRV